MKNPAQFYIQKLKLSPHPEGGYYREIYRSDETIHESALPARYKTKRSFGSLIYYLLENDQKSNFHILKSDEAWHHIDGCGVIIHCLSSSGKYDNMCLGKNISENQQPQLVIPKHTWFAAEIEDKTQFALVGCTVFPAFEFEDFKMGTFEELLVISPDQINLIKQFT